MRTKLYPWQKAARDTTLLSPHLSCQWECDVSGTSIRTIPFARAAETKGLAMRQNGFRRSKKSVRAFAKIYTNSPAGKAQPAANTLVSGIYIFGREGERDATWNYFWGSEREIMGAALCNKSPRCFLCATVHCACSQLFAAQILQGRSHFKLLLSREKSSINLKLYLFKRTSFCFVEMNAKSFN